MTKSASGTRAIALGTYALAKETGRREHLLLAGRWRQ